MDDTQKLEPLLTAQELRRLLKCSLPWIYKAADQGLIPCVRIPCPGKGKKKPRDMVRFKQNEIWDFIEKHHRAT